MYLVPETAEEVTISINTAVTQERPPASYLLGALQIDVNQKILRLFLRGLAQQFALGTADKTRPPKLYTTGLTAGVWLMSYPVHSHHRQAVGNSMTALHCLPGHALTLLLIGSIAALIADGRWINEEVGTSQGHQTRALRIPLIPTNLHPKFAYRGCDGMKTEVAGSEIELLVICRIIWNMHLALHASDCAVFLKDDSCVVV